MSELKILYQDKSVECASHGLSGYQTTGIQLTANREGYKYEQGVVQLTGLRKDKKLAAQTLGVPIKDIPQLIAALEKVYRENTPGAVFYTHESQHHYFDYDFWEEEVSEHNTGLGYHEWVEHQIESTEDDLTDAEMRFDMSAGRDIELADEIDELRRRLDPDAEVKADET